MRKLSKLSNEEISKLIAAYLLGDSTAGDRLLIQYNNLICRTVIDYFSTVDVFIGWSTHDVIQEAKIQLLNNLKYIKPDKHPMPVCAKDAAIWACNHFLRYAKAQKRDWIRQSEFDEASLSWVIDESVKSPETIAIDKELMELVEARVSELSQICQAIYKVAMEGSEGVYYSSNPVLKKIKHFAMRKHFDLLRKEIRQVLESY